MLQAFSTGGCVSVFADEFTTWNGVIELCLGEEAEGYSVFTLESEGVLTVVYDGSPRWFVRLVSCVEEVHTLVEKGLRKELERYETSEASSDES